LGKKYAEGEEKENTGKGEYTDILREEITSQRNIGSRARGGGSAKPTNSPD